MNYIEINGARTNNLQNISLKIPRGEFVVLTGVSGSGKSSLAIDTIHAESERQFIETLSLRSRQFIRQFPRPDVDTIKGLPPTIAITQHKQIKNKRDNVATLSEIYDYLRLIFARAGIVYCYKCNRIIQNQSSSQIITQILNLPQNTKFIVLAPLVTNCDGDHKKLLQNISKAGFSRVRINNDFHDIQDLPNINPKQKHTIEAVIDRLILKNDIELRLTESLQLALKHGNGVVIITHEKKTGSPDATVSTWQDTTYSILHSCPICNVNYNEIEPRTFSFNSPYGACKLCKGKGIIETKNPDNTTSEKICPECNGKRLGIESRNVKFCGKYIFEICSMTVAEALEFFDGAEIPADKREIVKLAIEQILLRLKFMNQNGLDYITLDRAADSLSGGELQRIRLANALGGATVGVCYVLDEPTAGLHARDTNRLIESLKNLQKKGNSLLIVEHDDDIMFAADRIIDMGTGAGELGGKIVGEMKIVKRSKNFHAMPICKENCCDESLTMKYINGDLSMPTPQKKYKNLNPNYAIKLAGVKTHNLQNIDVTLPLGKFICVTGVSGSGKSSLIGETLVPILRNYLANAKTNNKSDNKFDKKSDDKFDDKFDNKFDYKLGDKFSDKCCGIFGAENIGKLIEVDQSPIGRSMRSNPATYTGIFDEIRRLFAKTKEARQRGYDASWFLTGVKNITKNIAKGIDNESGVNKRYKKGGGCCMRCNGYGTIKIKMKILGDMVVTCPDCKGKRFNNETLEIFYKGRSIAETLEMSIAEAAVFFENMPRINKFLVSLCNIGLGYLKLGQSAVTLSGGEAQRLKLATELAKAEFNMLNRKSDQQDISKQTAQKISKNLSNSAVVNLSNTNLSDVNLSDEVFVNCRTDLYVLDEPTLGLHKHDVKRLLEILFGLVDCGASVIVVEHNLDVIRAADWIIDLGPGGGVNGGKIVATGTPKQIAKNKNSITAKFI
ncbi:MAG: hypothetical protein LBP59_07970 [Planctomycetaceae bacterium]|jgi:excinuclease ABC subunit A|nr:hypothetical protein [Planctomycetaceae bacterium]